MSRVAPDEPGESARQGTGLGARIGLLFLGLLGIVVLLIGIVADFWVAVVLWTIWTGLVILAYQHRRTRPLFAAFALVIVLVGIWGAWKLGQ